MTRKKSRAEKLAERVSERNPTDRDDAYRIALNLLAEDQAAGGDASAGGSGIRSRGPCWLHLGPGKNARDHGHPRMFEMRPSQRDINFLPSHLTG